MNKTVLNDIINDKLKELSLVTSIEEYKALDDEINALIDTLVNYRLSEAMMCEDCRNIMCDIDKHPCSSCRRSHDDFYEEET